LNSYKINLSSIAKIQVGYQARGKVEENLDGNFIIIRPQDFDSNGKLNIDQAMRFFPSFNIDPKNYLITDGDILVQARGQNHSAYLIDKEVINAVASNSFYIVRIRNDANIVPSYLAWWINQPKVQGYFEREQGLSTIPFISKSVLLKTKIIVPSISIQKRIGELIMLWKKEQELLQQLTEKKEILIQEVALKAAEQTLENK